MAFVSVDYHIPLLSESGRRVFNHIYSQRRYTIGKLMRITNGVCRTETVHIAQCLRNRYKSCPWLLYDEKRRARFEDATGAGGRTKDVGPATPAIIKYE